MIDIAVLLVASVALNGATGVVAAPDFVPPAVASSVTFAPASDDLLAAFHADRSPRVHHSKVDGSLLNHLGGSALLDQLALLDRTELAVYVDANPEAIAVLALDPPAANMTAGWWASLPTAVQQRLENDAPRIIGNLPGVPYPTRDAANRLTLDASIEALAAVNEGPESGIDPQAAARLRMLQQVVLALDSRPGEPERSLITLDTTGSGRAAVVVGDLLSADYVSYLVPGMLFTIEGQVVDWSDTAQELYDEQQEWMKVLAQTDPQFRDQTVATVAWMGYQTPDLFTVTSQELADQGALYLDSAMDALFVDRATNRPFVSVLAHSYGSTAAMKALATGNFEIDSFAVVGSPGSNVSSVDDLSVRARNVFVGQASWDPVASSGYFGNNPGSPAFGAHRMGVGGGVDLVTDEQLQASIGHNDYFAPNSESLRNMALIGINRGSLVSDGSGQDVQRTLAYFDRVI